MRGSVARGTNGGLRQALFKIGDGVFLIIVGMAAADIVQLARHLPWPFPLPSLFGMLLSMLAQMVLSFAAAPLLGSIESMTPSMVVAMFSAMIVDVLAMTIGGLDSACNWALGTALGAAVFIYLEGYARRFRRLLARGFPSSEEVVRDGVEFARATLRHL